MGRDPDRRLELLAQLIYVFSRPTISLLALTSFGRSWFTYLMRSFGTSCTQRGDSHGVDHQSMSTAWQDRDESTVIDVPALL